MVSAQPHFIAHLTLTTFSHESVAIYNSYGLKNFFLFYVPVSYKVTIFQYLVNKAIFHQSTNHIAFRKRLGMFLSCT